LRRVFPLVALDLTGDGKHGEEHGAHAARVVDAGERAGEEFELDAAGLEVGGEQVRCSTWARR
jgi:hypothetical protein